MAQGNVEPANVGLVLAGGGARGAYEIGALAALLPYLAGRGERPRVIVGTSVGALNGAFLASSSHESVDEVISAGRESWHEIGYRQVLEPLWSPRIVGRVLRYLGEFLGVPGVQLRALLDPKPLAATLQRIVTFEQIATNVEDGTIAAVGVAATSALTGRTVLFHHGGGPVDPDHKRGIDYVPTQLGAEHVRASAAIPGVFPAVHVSTPEPARGWYFDGGTRLNTPIKPALALGADRVVVIALNSIAAGPPQLAGERQPDVLDGVVQLLQAVLVDPLVHDLRTLATVNQLLAHTSREDTATAPTDKRRIPYIFVAPEEEQVGQLAMRVFNEHYARPRGLLRSPDLAALGRIVAGGEDPVHGELLSYLFFAPEFTDALFELGRGDAERWLAAEHDDGPWQLGPL